MPTRASQLPKNVASIWKAIRALQKQVAQIAGASTLQNATIIGGQLSVTDAGQIQCVNTDGTVVFMVGQLLNGDYGTVLNRSDDGSNAFFVGGGDTSGGGEAGVTAIASRTHNWLYSDDPFNPQYGGVPSMPVPMYCVGPNASPAVTTSTDTEFWVGGFEQTRAIMYLNIQIQAPASTTIAVHVDIQTINGGSNPWTQMAQTTVTGTTTVWSISFAPKQGYGVYSNVRINASRTSGTGTGGVVPLSCYQRMSANSTEGASA